MPAHRSVAEGDGSAADQRGRFARIGDGDLLSERWEANAAPDAGQPLPLTSQFATLRETLGRPAGQRSRLYRPRLIAIDIGGYLGEIIPFVSLLWAKRLGTLARGAGNLRQALSAPKPV